ncbi:MAG: hypothetical protein HQK94_19020 [Nitrospirae bacterium]|nr:hypothetical protein [Nitrospirota bacterium]
MEKKRKTKKKVSKRICYTSKIPDDCPFLDFLFSLEREEREIILDVMRRKLAEPPPFKMTIPPNLSRMTPEEIDAFIEDDIKRWEEKDA